MIAHVTIDIVGEPQGTVRMTVELVGGPHDGNRARSAVITGQPAQALVDAIEAAMNATLTADS